MKLKEVNLFIDGMNKMADYLYEREEKKGDIVIETIDIDYNLEREKISEEEKNLIPDDFISFVEKLNNINFEWNLKEFEDKFMGLGKIEISPREIFTNITEDKEYYYKIEGGQIELSFDDKEKYDRYKFSYLDLFGGPDAYTVVISPKDNLKTYQLGILKYQGSEGFLLDWKLKDYLFNLFKTAGLFYWPDYLSACKFDYNCLVKEVLDSFEYSEKNEKILKEILDDLHKINSDILS